MIVYQSNSPHRSACPNHCMEFEHSSKTLTRLSHSGSTICLPGRRVHLWLGALPPTTERLVQPGGKGGVRPLGHRVMIVGSPLQSLSLHDEGCRVVSGKKWAVSITLHAQHQEGRHGVDNKPETEATFLPHCEFFFFKIYFVDYAIMFVSFIPPSFPSPCAHLPPSLLPLSSCPWVIYISSLASTCFILFLTSCTILYLPFTNSYSLYLFPHFPPNPLPINNPPCNLHFCESVPVLIVCLVFGFFRFSY